MTQATMAGSSGMTGQRRHTGYGEMTMTTPAMASANIVTKTRGNGMNATTNGIEKHASTS